MAGWVCGAGGVALVDGVGDVGGAGACRVALFEGASEFGPGVASRSWSGGSAGEACEVGVDCFVSGGGQASTGLPDAEEGAGEVASVSLALELDACMCLAQRHADAVAESHQVRLSAGAVDADHAHGLLGRHLARLVQGGEGVRGHRESLAGGMSGVGDGASREGVREHQLSFQLHDNWRRPTTERPQRPPVRESPPGSATATGLRKLGRAGHRRNHPPPLRAPRPVTTTAPAGDPQESWPAGDGGGLPGPSTHPPGGPTHGVPPLVSDDDLDLSLLPAGLRHLAPLISRYSEADNVARADLLAAESPDELRSLPKHRPHTGRQPSKPSPSSRAAKNRRYR